MKRFHAHIAVADLAANIDFYSKLFGQEPTKVKDDYAKWMLDDPRINFAISTRSPNAGVDHFGLQVDTEEELSVIKNQEAAVMGSDLGDTEQDVCCYAHSQKYWLADPSGIPWEHFVSMKDSPTYNASHIEQNTVCCTPSTANDAPQQSPASQGGCC